MKRDIRHVPVLLGPVLEILSPRPGQIVLDCTLGLGGHSAALLEQIGPTGRLIGVDFDPANLAIAAAALEKISGNFQLFHNNFAAIPSILIEAGIERVDAILADLGVASPQIDD